MFTYVTCRLASLASSRKGLGLLDVNHTDRSVSDILQST